MNKANNTGYNAMHTRGLFKTLNTLPLFQLIKLRTDIFMYEIYHRKMPHCILKCFTYSNNVYDTRQCDKMLLLKQIRTKNNDK